MKKHLNTTKMISDIIRYLEKNPVPLNKEYVWLITDESIHVILSGSDKDIMKLLGMKYSLRYGKALELLHELYEDDRLVSWKYGNVKDRNFFITADGNTTIEPKEMDDTFTYYTTGKVSGGGVIEVPAPDETKEAPKLKCISTKEGFFDRAGFVLGEKLTEELMDELFPEEKKTEGKEESTPKEPEKTLTGVELARLLAVEQWDYDGFTLEGNYLHPEKLLSSEEETGVPTTLIPIINEDLRSGETWKNEEGKQFLYLGMTEDEVHYFYFLGPHGFASNEDVQHKVFETKEPFTLVTKKAYIPMKYR